MIRIPYVGRKVWAVLDVDGEPVAARCEVMWRTGAGWYVRALDCAYVYGTIDKSRMYRTCRQADKRARDEMQFRKTL